jgi:hypothetical protein
MVISSTLGNAASTIFLFCCLFTMESEVGSAKRLLCATQFHSAGVLCSCVTFHSQFTRSNRGGGGMCFPSALLEAPSADFAIIIHAVVLEQYRNVFSHLDRRLYQIDTVSKPGCAKELELHAASMTISRGRFEAPEIQPPPIW